MSHGTSGGVELTDELLQEIADEAEQGYDTEDLRPRMKMVHTHEVSQSFFVEEPFWEVPVHEMKKLLDEAPEDRRTTMRVELRKVGSIFHRKHQLVFTLKWFEPTKEL